MPYLYCLPSLICAIALSVEDIRHRRVPRAWVGVFFLLQLVADLVWAGTANQFFVVLQALLFAVLCAFVQLLLALAKPGALGFGDVTAMLPLGLAVGMYGLDGVVVWWVAMSVLGLALIALWSRFDLQRNTPYRGKTPFVPAIAAGAAVAVFSTRFSTML